MVLALESRVEERDSGISCPVKKKSDKARNVSVVSLNKYLDITLCEAVMLKPRLSWRSQDVGDARAMGYLPRRAANREWN